MADAYLAASSALLYPRHHYGTDGSDQVSFQTLSAACVARAIPDERIQDAALWYVALQSGLCYLISGGVKLFGPSWRSGGAVPGVMRTTTYGCELLWRFFSGRPRLAALSAHSMLLGESLFVLVFLTRGKLARLFIVASAFFHLGIGWSMGLGRFATAFGSMLPAVAFATNDKPKSNMMPKMALGILGLVLCAGLVAAHRRRRRVIRGSGECSSLVLKDGTELRLMMSRPVRPGRPVLVLEHGMLSTPAHFDWICEAVGDEATVVTYARRGYGASASRRSAVNDDLSADDLMAVTAEMSSRENPVLVGGHSLGGYLARLAAENSQFPVAGVVYIDAAHPAQLEKSPKQREGAVQLEHALAGVPTSMRLGLGWLLARPAWIADLPSRVQGRVFDQYRDGRMWSAGIAEWRRSKRHFALAANHELKALGMPALVLSAEGTIRADEKQNRLNQEMADSHAHSVHVVIRGATHDSILTNAAHAGAAADAIRAFLRDTGKQS